MYYILILVISFEWVLFDKEKKKRRTENQNKIAGKRNFPIERKRKSRSQNRIS